MMDAVMETFSSSTESSSASEKGEQKKRILVGCCTAVCALLDLDHR